MCASIDVRFHRCSTWPLKQWDSTSHCFQVKSGATVMLPTVWQLATCANQSWVPASPDFLTLRTQIPHSPMAAWTLSEAQWTSAQPDRHRTTLALPCLRWNAVTKICVITEGCMMFSLLPRERPQVQVEALSNQNACLIYRLVTAMTLYGCCWFHC